MKITLVVLLSVILGVCICDNSTPSFSTATVQQYKLVASSGQSKLYDVILDSSSSKQYEWGIQLIDLRGDRYSMGYDYGYLLANQITEMYEDFFASLLGTTFEAFLFRGVAEIAMDWQWNSYLSLQTPQDYLMELKGIKQGGITAGIRILELDKVISRVIVLANAPGTLTDFLYILIDEFNHTLSNPHKDWEAHGIKYEDVNKAMKFAHQQQLKQSNINNPFEPLIAGHQCSMFGVWGTRTQGGQLFSARNLDWQKDTGIAKHKLITVYHPQGKYSHATIGFAGLYGALAGMSSQGLSVHEANLEENEITFYGIPWVLRLRYIMENANDLESAVDLWHQTNNTVGFNHMITSAKDIESVASVVMETMEDYTAYFFDNDKREASALYKGQNIGFPLENALWRTNHGYDPRIREHYTWSQSPKSWSMDRYMFAHEAFTAYQRNKILIGENEALNITSILGDKGKHAYQCENNTDGSNILSVMFIPGKGQLYSSWEDGTKDSWRPASCNIYTKFDLNQFWN